MDPIKPRGLLGPHQALLLLLVWAAAASGQTVERGPYLQLATATGIAVRWRTDQIVDGVVRYGTSPAALTSSAAEGGVTSEHEVALSGLQPDTRYYYSIGTSAGALAGDASYTFVTAPPVGMARATRIWVVGDSGEANSAARAVRDAYLAYTGSRGTDLWLMLGDNAYVDGTDVEYQAAVFETYPQLLRQAPVWPTLGNHDGHSASSAAQSGPYYDIFTLPTNAEAGGLASGTEAYYSFDRANIHFVVLDSYDSNRAANGPMLTWLENDLAATQQDWLVAFWHHPPYSKGSHNSDTETELIDMRENALPLLESYGVDLVLAGHSHSYERSYLIDHHYGTSSTFDASMQIDAGSGREDDTGAYEKSPSGAMNQGAVYAVAGSSSKIEGGSLNHPAMYVSLNVLGSMVLDFDGLRLDAHFLDDAGNELDYFTLRKDGGAPVDAEPPTEPQNLRVDAATSQDVSLVWDAASDNVGVTAYRVSRDGQLLATTGTTSFNDTGLQAGTTYEYAVTALDAAGNVSTAARVTAQTSGAPDSEAPSAPPNLRVTATSAGSVQLAWDASTDNVAVTGYRVSRDGQLRGTVAGLEFVDSGLQPATGYSYGVMAVDAAANLSASATLMVTTDTAPTPPSSGGGGGGGAVDLLLLLTLLASLPGRLGARARRRMLASGCAFCVALLAAPPVGAHPELEAQIARVSAQLVRHPEDAALYLTRGDLERLHREFDQAEADFAAAERCGDGADRDELALYRGRLYQDAGQSARAIRELDRYIARHPRHVDALRVRALAYAARNELDAAVADYTRLIAAGGSRSPELWLERAKLLVRAGDVDAALASLDEAVLALGPLVTLIEFAIDIDVERGATQAALARLQSLPTALTQTPQWLWRRAKLLRQAGSELEADQAAARARAAILDLPPLRRRTLAMQDLWARLQ